MFDARTLRFEPALRTRAYAPDRLISLHIMDRSIYCDSARDIYRFYVTVHDVDVMSLDERT